MFTPSLAYPSTLSGLFGNSVYYNYSVSRNGTREPHGNSYAHDYLPDLVINATFECVPALTKKRKKKKKKKKKEEKKEEKEKKKKKKQKKNGGGEGKKKHANNDLG